LNGFLKMSTNKILDAANDYYMRRMLPLPLYERQKKPKLKAWSKTLITEADLDKEFSNPKDNIGIKLGQVSDNLCDIDLDCAEAVAFARHILPPTKAVFGRKSRGASHFLYRTTSPAKTKRLTSGKSVIVEIRSDGAQTMVPPSVHPSGEEVVWYSSGEPAVVETEELSGAVTRLAAAVLIARNWPTKGQRHDFSLAVAGALARAGLKQADVEILIGAVTAYVGDEEADSRTRNVKDTFQALFGGGRTYGLPKIAEIAGNDAAAELRRLLNLSASASQETARQESWIEKMTLWRSEADDAAFATIDVGDHFEHVKVRSRHMRQWLRRQIRRKSGKSIPKSALDDEIEEIEARALDGDTHRPFIRIAPHDEKFYIDLCNAKWQAIEISAQGWSVVDNPPVKFVRSVGMQSLPTPRAGTIDALRPFVNVASEDDFVLYVAALLGALVPSIPYVILIVSGEQGTSKTTMCNIFRSLVDPNTAAVRSLPRREQELFISAANSWLLVFDNVSYIPAQISDALCRIATGASFVTRRLYTDDEEVLLTACRPVLMNSIPSIAERPDLLDRAIILTLPVIDPEKRRPEREFKKAFEDAAPGILGAICGGLCAVLRNRSSVNLENAPRMADFAECITAAEEGLGWPSGTFMKAYEANRLLAMTDLAAQDPVIEAIRRMLTTQLEIIQPAAMLLRTLTNALTEKEAQRRDWPKQPNQLSRALRRLAPVMRSMGIDIDLDYDRDRETNVKRIRLSHKIEDLD
jgi:uncharacterized coiled-coil protein SlyX